MPSVTYQIVEHDGGWAYRVEGTYSETFASHEAALNAARRAAREQRLPGDTEGIEFEDARGVWREEVSSGDDRPETRVED
jgi:Uncharacterized protein conserved in bacteria (DUF2188)